MTSNPTAALDPDSPTLGRLGLVVLLVGPFLANLDLFITNVALPSIERDLDCAPAALVLIAAGYGTSYALILVAGGRLGDRFGRRRIFAVGLAAFASTSLLAGLAPTAGLLIGARFLQGGAAALLTPQVLATVRTVLDGRARARAIGGYAVAGGLSAVAGQLVGGVLVQADVLGLGWRTVFLVNVPFGLAALLLLRRAVPESRSPSAAGLDPLGVVLLGIALVGLLVPLTEGPALGWPWWSLAMLAAVAPAVVLFAVVERRVERRGRLPLLPRELLAVPSVRRGIPVLMVFFLAVGAFLFGFALTSQDLLGLSPLASGLAVTPVTVAYVITSFLVPNLLRRFGRGVLVGGGLLQAVGFAGAALLIATGCLRAALPLLLLSLVACGVGQAAGVGALFRIVLSGVPGHLAGVGGGVMVTAQQTALALGVAVLGSMFSALLPVDPTLAVAVLGAALIATQLLTVAGVALLPRLDDEAGDPGTIADDRPDPASSALVAEVRPLRGDVEARRFQEISRRWLIDEHRFTLDAEDEDALARPAEYYEERGGEALVAYRGDEVVGVVALLRENETTFELCKLGVDPAARGAGVGALLIRAALDRARERGATRIVLETNSRLQAARRLYDAAGFTPEPRPEGPRRGRAEIRMGLDLRQAETTGLLCAGARSVDAYAPFRRRRGAIASTEGASDGCGSGRRLG